jgi:hypothetical protein
VNRQEINQQNAQHSTGPKTPEGKYRSSQNALRHGLTSQIVVMPGEEIGTYKAHFQSFEDEYKPKGPTEAHLVQTLADTAWRMQRVSSLENNLLSIDGEKIQLDRDWRRNALAEAASITKAERTRTFAILSLHDQRLHRKFEKTLKLLRQVQADRRAQEQQQLEVAANVCELVERRGGKYDPADDGFVFSKSEVTTFLKRRDRAQEAADAKKNITWGVVWTSDGVITGPPERTDIGQPVTSLGICR